MSKSKPKTVEVTGAARLTPKQALFVAEYLIDGNASAAARRAGYSKKTAFSIGQENLKKPSVSEAIAKATAEKMAEIDFSATRVLRELARLALFDPAKLFNQDGSVKAIHEMDENSRMAIAGFEVVELPGGKGVLKKFRLADKGANLERLGRYHKLFTDKSEWSGPGGGPIPLTAVPHTALSNEQLEELLLKNGRPLPLKLIEGSTTKC